jgi:hypothetical protein
LKTSVEVSAHTEFSRLVGEQFVYVFKNNHIQINEQHGALYGQVGIEQHGFVPPSFESNCRQWQYSNVWVYAFGILSETHKFMCHCEIALCHFS